MTTQTRTARAAATPGTRDDTGAARPRFSADTRASDVAPSSTRERRTPRTARRRRGDSSDDPDASDADASDDASGDDDDARRDRWEAKRRRLEVERSTRRCANGDPDDDDDADEDASFDPATETTAGPPCVLRLEYWMRSEECTERKRAHVAAIDNKGGYWGMEDHIERTVFRTIDPKTKKETFVDVALEANMFPYECPPFITHWTLWSRHEMSPREICKWTKMWLKENKPGVKQWNFDMNDNNSVDVPHYHVFLYEPPRESEEDAETDGIREKTNDEKKPLGDFDAKSCLTRREKTRKGPRTPPPFGDEAQEPKQ